MQAVRANKASLTLREKGRAEGLKQLHSNKPPA